MSLGQDVAFAARILRRSPAFTATAVLSLAVGIAANAAIFSLADALLLRPRPGIAEPDRLVDVGRSQEGSGFDNMSYPDYLVPLISAAPLREVTAIGLLPQRLAAWLAGSLGLVGVVLASIGV